MDFPRWTSCFDMTSLSSLCLEARLDWDSLRKRTRWPNHAFIGIMEVAEGKFSPT